MVRGKNNIKIESNCTWGVPKDTWSEKKFSDKLVEGKSSNLELTEAAGCAVNKTYFEGGELIKTNMSLRTVKIPEAFDW